MSKVLFITTSPRKGGNGDALMETAMEAAKSAGAEVTRLDLRTLTVNGCKSCNACKVTGSCSQKDDFAAILEQMKASDSILVSSPIYFNLPCSQAIALLNRCFVLFGPPSEAPETEAPKAKKKLGILLTFGGSDPEKMKEIASLGTMFFQGNTEQRIETFPNTADKDSCKNSSEYLKRAEEMGTWAAK